MSICFTLINIRSSNSEKHIILTGDGKANLTPAGLWFEVLTHGSPGRIWPLTPNPLDEACGPPSRPCCPRADDSAVSAKSHPAHLLGWGCAGLSLSLLRFIAQSRAAWGLRGVGGEGGFPWPGAVGLAKSQAPLGPQSVPRPWNLAGFSGGQSKA